MKDIPTRKKAVLFQIKALLLRLKRTAADMLISKPERHGKAGSLGTSPVIAESTSRLWTESDPRERSLTAGKIHNLRLAAARLDGIEIPAGKTFSFWKQVGRASRLKGFAEGRELREGCIVPSIGGGLCQISNALYDAALQSGFEVIERHAHTEVIPGSLAEQGRDATVFWNYVDLRFRSDTPFRIETKLTADDLSVTFRGQGRSSGKSGPVALRRSGDGPNSCAACGVSECHRMVPVAASADFGRTAFLLDEHFPEFDRYITEVRSPADRLMIPLDGRRFRKANYAWTTSGFGRVSQSLFATAKRSYRSRKLSAQGAARQKNLLRMYEELADSYARGLAWDVLHVVVQQNLLPFLWQKGHLGGRTFDVLMTALPMNELQATLDRAQRLHPESTTLDDFRADPDLVSAETQALRHARQIITPHTAIAKLFPNRGRLIKWVVPRVPQRSSSRNARPQIVFPASTVGRKGCWELREALRGLDFDLVLLGPLIEDPDFWQGCRIAGPNDWLESADLVVLPAFVEHKPRRLLAAAAAGIPVIASSACGVSNVPGVETVGSGDPVALRESILFALSGVGAA